MSPVHDELTFGDSIVAAMLGNGWRESIARRNPEFGVDRGESPVLDCGCVLLHQQLAH
ncbi:hypothetical protein IU438_22295 [Nocardia cyriacigeorgica]|uniref:hypothetical protein n=1 Tax=Nocardia cyriacigeorgica TaxID=135487 RepID=UPI00189469BE|nr:hypothetical protein [Nocardia cyriacigeorgica]MBF6088902.1 hypothetical protein [Nocardia cyriacigeorgica]MBF6093480.1 hypothetical protein [Nocardia cyriacigeorgica]MBF6398518.1 hypothetical protein [Nocardia cyriacigeorgica]MBF6403968.1 hypothetical protein [Nocardia cyriacigeorgica]